MRSKIQFKMFEKAYEKIQFDPVLQYVAISAAIFEEPDPTASPLRRRTVSVNLPLGPEAIGWILGL